MGRYWLDVSCLGDDNPTTEATNPSYPNAWRYRDWVIDAFNRDLPYDQFAALRPVCCAATRRRCDSRNPAQRPRRDRLSRDRPGLS
ncbi:MAG: DUF1549 domain-containing protein [Undibacterium sp.]|nr:DUF1549 domain-containing protein [Opitutaceae bacterium]